MKFIDLYAGAGGVSLGLKRAGLEPQLAYDFNEDAVATYVRNLGAHAEVEDLTNIIKLVPKILDASPDIIVGGPPCQDFSAAGKRLESAQAPKTTAFTTVVCATRPQWFLMENVPLAKRSSTWLRARKMLVNAGYGLTEVVLDASYYNVPQARKRFIVIGRLGERDGFLTSALTDAASQQQMTLRDYFGVGLPDTLYFHARMPGKKNLFNADEPAPTIRSASDRRMPSPIFRGEDQALLENGYFYSRPYRGGRGVLSIDQPMKTITRTAWERPTDRYKSSPHPNDPVPADQAACLSREQLSQIQGFPSDWVWVAKSQRSKMQMIANAVPAPLAEAIGRVILARHRGKTSPAVEPGFVTWLADRGSERRVTYKIKSNLIRARKMLGGRTYKELSLEIASLEVLPAFQALLPVTRSDLRKALRLYSTFLSCDEHERRRMRRSRVMNGGRTNRGDPSRANSGTSMPTALN